MMERHEQTHRVMALLDREQIDFLDRLGKDALFTTGAKISRTKLLSTMVCMMERLGVSTQGVHSEEELEQRFVEAMSKFHPE